MTPKEKNEKCRSLNKHLKLFNAKITFNFNCYDQKNGEKSPVQSYLYFERTFRKWSYFCLNELIFKDQKIMRVLQKHIFFRKARLRAHT